MAKKVTGQIKLQIPAGQANPAPGRSRAGAARRQHHGVLQGIQRRHQRAGRLDHSRHHHGVPGQVLYFHHQVTTCLCSAQKAAGIASGSKTPNKDKVGKVTRKQIMDIVKLKAKDLNTTGDEAAFRVISGTARSMGIEVKE